jgi:hypothetical protein
MQEDTCELQTEIEWVVENFSRIPEKYKRNIMPRGRENLQELNDDAHIVVLLLDRQKPSVQPNYDFDEERIGINKYGQVIWGFDSGCSCPISWVDHYPECYNISRSWKEFVVNLKDFDRGAIAEMLNAIKEIKEEVSKTNMRR